MGSYIPPEIRSLSAPFLPHRRAESADCSRIPPQQQRATDSRYQSRIKELQTFIQSQPKRLTFDDTLVKHLLAKITIFPEHLLFAFKSGVNITIEK